MKYGGNSNCHFAYCYYIKRNKKTVFSNILLCLSCLIPEASRKNGKGATFFFGGATRKSIRNWLLWPCVHAKEHTAKDKITTIFFWRRRRLQAAAAASDVSWGMCELNGWAGMMKSQEKLRWSIIIIANKIFHVVYYSSRHFLCLFHVQDKRLI